ncbi:response regulator transcription factor [Streptomyces xanthophaeus]|uniref:response regulator transcription factor n=1 Tax=Streptomyces xanthophaeus TaxID=67385 RepID=UPI0039901F8E
MSTTEVAARTASSHRQGRPASGSVSFSEREIQVAELLADGLATPEIGQRLHLSEHTVASYVKYAKAKLGVHTGAALVLGLYEHGLLAEPIPSPHPLDLDDDVRSVLPLLVQGVPGSQIALRLKRPVTRVRADMQTAFASVSTRNAAHAVRQLRRYGLRYPLRDGPGAST